MTDTAEPDLPPELAEWATKPIYPSALFGGTREELWSAQETGVLFLGFATLNDGLTTLRGLMNTPTDAEDKADALTEASEWMAGASQYMDLHVSDKVSKPSDRADVLLEITTNIAFLLESIGENVGRLGS